MPGLAQELGALFLVAAVADLWLGFQGEYRIIRCVQVMAVHAGVFFDVMHTAWPMEPGAIVVTAEADFVLSFHRGCRLESDSWRQSAAIFLPFGVGLARAMAGFAIVIAFGEG